jgi:hypothetical protein
LDHHRLCDLQVPYETTSRPHKWYPLSDAGQSLPWDHIVAKTLALEDLAVRHPMPSEQNHEAPGSQNLMQPARAVFPENPCLCCQHSSDLKYIQQKSDDVALYRVQDVPRVVVLVRD